jgi:hypothetical protein
MTFDLDAKVPADRLIGALTDASDQGSRLFANLDPRLSRVHALGGTWVEVTEGSAFGGACVRPPAPRPSRLPRLPTRSY